MSVDTPVPARARPRTLVADDHPLMLSVIARLAGTECEVIGTVSDGVALLREVRRHRPDLVILDIFMPVMDGFTAGRQIKNEFPETRLIYVTLDAERALVAEAIRIGASALLPKASAGSRLLGAIRKTMADAS